MPGPIKKNKDDLQTFSASTKNVRHHMMFPPDTKQLLFQVFLPIQTMSIIHITGL